MPVPRISVVVPFYNNEDLLGDCLKSIAAQSISDFEVLMVDDGSTDGSAAVAAAQAAADPRFKLVQVPHGGSPGYTRNQGIKRATGEYLSFVDADDTLPPHALEHMMHTLEKSGSDFVTGGVLRTGPMGVTPSVMHAKAIKTRQIGTHISRNADLFFDVSVWNKMYRKSFWDAHQLVFPEGVVWEDLQLITKAHVLAKAVDVIPEPIYYWRERGKGALSITQSRTSIKNFRDRITALTVIDDFLRQHKPARLVAEHQYKSLVNDLWLYVPDLGRTTAGVPGRVHRPGRQVPGPGGARRAAQAAVHAQAGLSPDLPEPAGRAAGVRRLPERAAGQDRARSCASTAASGRTCRSARTAASASRRASTPPRCASWTRWSRSRASAGRTASWSSPAAPTSRRSTSASGGTPRRSSLLRPRTRGRLPVVVRARSFLHAEAKTYSAQERYDYDWAGFRAEISPRWFRPLGHWQTGDWDAFILVRGRGVWRPARLHSPVPGSAERPCRAPGRARISGSARGGWASGCTCRSSGRPPNWPARSSTTAS